MGRLHCLQSPSPSRQLSDAETEGCAARPLGSLPYQVGSSRRAFGALLGGIVGAGAEVGAGHTTPIEGTEDADGGFARADDEKLLSIAGVGSVIPQHLAQVPWKSKAVEALSKGDTRATAVVALGHPSPGGSEDVLR